MKRVNLREFPEFWKDYRNRTLGLTCNLDVSDGTKIIKGWYSDNEQLIKDWYGFDVNIDRASSIGAVSMSDRDYTIFILRYGK